MSELESLAIMTICLMVFMSLPIFLKVFEQDCDEFIEWLESEE